ncbi:hypothetical protein N431DRAFT_101826, partial [Stipitochalara longipes BDJ]
TSPTVANQSSAKILTLRISQIYTKDYSFSSHREESIESNSEMVQLTLDCGLFVGALILSLVLGCTMMYLWRKLQYYLFIKRNTRQEPGEPVMRYGRRKLALLQVIFVINKQESLYGDGEETRLWLLEMIGGLELGSKEYSADLEAQVGDKKDEREGANEGIQALKLQKK